jgi:hypothetical protein
MLDRNAHALRRLFPNVSGRASAVSVTTDCHVLRFPIFTRGRHRDEPNPLDAGVQVSRFAAGLASTGFA